MIAYQIYFFYKILAKIVSGGPSQNAIVRINPDDSQAWSSSFSFQPVIKGLAVDASEQNVYVSQQNNPLNVLWMYATNGSIASMQS